MHLNLFMNIVLLLLCGLACGSSKGKDEPAPSLVSSDAQTPLPAAGLPSYRTPSQLPVCNISSEGLMYWVDTENSFAVCRGGQYQYVDLQGLPGLDGKNGTDGKSVNNNDNSIHTDLMISVQDSNKNQLGYRLNSQGFFNVDVSEIVLLLSDKSIAKFSLNSGEFRNSLAINKNDGTIDSDVFCAFTSIDCTGTCYLNGDSYRPMRNVLFRNPDSLLKVSGNESDAGPQIVNSVFTNGSCIAVNSVGISQSYAISTAYQLPAGLQLPLAVPFDFSVTLN